MSTRRWLVAALAPAVCTLSASAVDLDVFGRWEAYEALDVKALDQVHDTARPDSPGDLMALYYDAEPDGLRLRIDLFRSSRVPLLPIGAPLRVTARLTVGREATTLEVDLDAPGADGASGADGSERVRLRDGNGHEIVDAIGGWRLDRDLGVLEVSLALPPGFERATLDAARASGRFPAGAAYADVMRWACETHATPIEILVTTEIDGVVIDTISGTEAARGGSHNIAFVHHGNQGITYSTVLRGERGESPGLECSAANPDDGFDELLALHECTGVPGAFHLSGTLQTAAEWHDPTFNQWLADGAAAGWADMITSAYGQHIMPFAQHAMNEWAVNVEADMIDWRYDFVPRVAWVPERVWLESPDADGNGIDASCGVVDPTLVDNWLQHGVDAVILDDAWHMAYYDGPFDDRQVYTLWNGLRVVPIDNDFVGAVNHDWGAAWNMIVGLSPDELMVYGNDWEFAAEVSQGADNPEALNNYVNIILQAQASSATVHVWRLTDAIYEPAFQSGTGGIVVQNATYGLLGAHGGYGGSCNGWYTDWAGYVGPDNSDAHDPKWDYGTIWNNAWTKLSGVPSNDVSEAGWYTMMSMLHETGWHDDGQISGWIHHYSNHIKNANVYAEAARWAGGLYAENAGAFPADLDEDGVEELVIYNDRLYAVFESVGGRLAWMFAKGIDHAYPVIGNDPVYWADTNGDFNETNHVATLSDVSVGGRDRQFDLYALEVIEGIGDDVSIRLSHPDVSKTISASVGDPFLRVRYDNRGQDTYVKSGWSPHLTSLIWSADMERVWGDGGTYFGYQDPNTNATGAVVAGSAGAAHNGQFELTLLGGDELYADAPFEVLLYGGYASTADASDHVAELEALAAGLVDEIGPRPLSALYYPGPDRLVVFTDQTTAIASVDVTGFGIDADDDGVAEVGIGGGSTLRTTTDGRRFEIDLEPATASALEVLTAPDLELLVAAGSMEDLAGNGNDTITNADDVALVRLPETTITIDGFIDPAEWTSDTRRVDDYWDSGWTTSAPADTNEVQALFCTWDDTYLYLGVQGKVYGNSWILYLDTDPGGPNGEVDLTAIDAWERGATFSRPGFRVDWQYGCYQHQSPFDTDGFFRVTSPTAAVDNSSLVQKAFDSMHVYGDDGGSELAIPWDVLYELGPGVVPANASIAFVASLCWDPEPAGELGGDVAPDNVSAVLPEVDGAVEVVVDVNGDGIPDDPGLLDAGDASGPATRPGARLIDRVAPNPLRSGTTIQFAFDSPRGRSERVAVRVFDVAGRLVADLFSGSLEPGRHEIRWDRRSGDRAVPAGSYLVRVDVGDRVDVGKTTVLD